MGFFGNWRGLVGLGFRVIGGGWGGVGVPFASVVCIVMLFWALLELKFFRYFF